MVSFPQARMSGVSVAHVAIDRQPVCRAHLCLARPDLPRLFMWVTPTRLLRRR